MQNAVSVVAVALLMGLSGCFSTVRQVQKTQLATMYRTTSIEQLNKGLTERDEAIKTLNASVLITATVGGGRVGKVTEYTAFRGYIFVRKPQDLRVLLQLPVLGSKALDMVSDGNGFTLMRASQHGNVWMQGTNKVSTPSKNGLENLRPPVFFDSLLVPGLKPGEFVTLTESTRVLEPQKGRHEAVEEPDYEIEILRPKAGNMMQVLRVVHISRVDMLPFQQDIYDDQGRIVTVATYENYQPYGDILFPSRVNIKRPLDEYALKIDVTKLTLNGKLDDDQFELKIPAGVTVQKME